MIQRTILVFCCAVSSCEKTAWRIPLWFTKIFVLVRQMCEYICARVCVLKQSIHPSHITTLTSNHIHCWQILICLDLFLTHVDVTCSDTHARTHKRAHLSVLSVYVLCLPFSVRGCNFYRTEALSEAENRH